MTQAELQNILVPGAKLESFVIDENNMEIIMTQTHERQEAILKQKIVTREALEQVITI